MHWSMQVKYLPRIDGLDFRWSSGIKRAINEIVDHRPGRHKVGRHIPETPEEEEAMTAYSLEVQNNSSGYTNFCMYQSPPDTNLGVQVETLAWFVEPAYPTTTTTFAWDVDYSFCWSEAGPLSAGVTFSASQVWAADPMNPVQQAVQLHRTDRAYTFQRLAADIRRHPGNLYIEQGGDVPLREASVGIGMSGSGTHAVEAQPNLHLIFTPHPRYWLVAGNFEHGEVLDMAEVSNAIEIDYYGAQTSKKLSYSMSNLFEPVQ